ncbi:protein hold'em-like [Musca vetustissima]|uniref:protein hold'em-like n=1 Tax=Musca vetustissima TaxID=27455 RepID=UPI002AB7042B|nr:protein hold'em-like [Musca vetustissima]
MNSKDKTTPLTTKKLYQLHPEMENILIVAMVVGKTEPNIFLSRNDTQHKGVMTFTLRDTSQHIVNCKFWGTREKVAQLNEHIQMGDIVDIVCPKISMLSQKAEALESKQAQYQPVSSLPITLVVNEGQGLIEKHSYHDLDKYTEIRLLSHQSHKPLYSVMNLADVQATFSDSKAQAFHTDFLVVVGLLRRPRDVNASKEGRQRRCLEIVVFDQSLTSGMTFTIWHSDWIDRAEASWQPMKTVLHLIDVKVSYSNFYKGCILSFTSKSIIYENPVGTETQHLKTFAATLPKTPFDMAMQASNTDALPKADDIQTVMTVRQIYARAEGHLRDTSEQFTAKVYAMVTHFDIDWPEHVLSKKCKSCNRYIAARKDLCDNDQCQLAFSFGYSGDKYDYFFNINLQLTDHTGTLVEARLTDTTAMQILSFNCDQYLKLNQQELEQLKWRFLLNHVEAKLLIKKSNMLRRKMLALIIDLKPIELEQLTENIAVF